MDRPGGRLTSDRLTVDRLTFDLAERSVTAVNRRLHELTGPAEVEVLHPSGRHNVACGLRAPLDVRVRGHSGYFTAGMNHRASVTVHGNVGWSVAENMMSGTVRVAGFASECAGASAHGGLLVIDGDASSRCGISLKGGDIVVGGSVGHMTAFMAQAGRIVVCGDAGAGLGDSLYEAVIYVRGRIRGLGADARTEPLGDQDLRALAELLRRAGRSEEPESFTRVASARQLYHWNPGRGEPDRADEPTGAEQPAGADGPIPAEAPAGLPGSGPAGARRQAGAPRWAGAVSSHYDADTLDYVRRAAETGVYDIRGLGAKRRVPSFDDLTFLTASMSRYPLEGYRERCSTTTVLGSRRAERPLTLQTPITIAGMSFGSLSANVKEALGRAATAAGTSTTTGDGGMTAEERQASRTLVYQCLPSRYGFNPDDLRRADAVEIVVGQGAKPGGGGMLLGLKVSERVAAMRTLPAGIDQRSACRHPDWVGPDDLAIKIEELREVTDNRIPVFIKIGATRVTDDVKLCVKSGADVIVLDGMQGGTAATQQVFIEHAGIPTLPAVRQAVEALEEVDPAREVQLVVSGGIRSGADVAKALALGADAVSIGQAVLMALGCNADSYVRGGERIDATADYHRLGTVPGRCHQCQTGRCPVGVTTQDPELERRLDPAWGARRVRNYLATLTMELTTLARACGKSNVHHLEREDLAALTVEAAAMAGVPLAGTDWIPGRAPHTAG